MDKSRALTWTELRVGLVVVVSLVLLAATILYIGGGGGSPFARKYTIKALMADVNGLKPGAPVRVGGVEVGTVTKVDFAGAGEGGLVEVVMRVDERVKDRVTTSSQANLGALGLLGEKAVDITASPRGTPIQEGGYIPAAGEDVFKSFLADSSEATAHLKKILARMDAGEGLIGKALRDEELYDRMVDVSVRLQSVMTRLEGSEGPLGRLINDRDLSRQLASSVRGIEATVSRVEAGQGALGALSKDEKLASDLRQTVDNLGQVAARLERGEGSAGRLLADDALYRRMDEAMARFEGVMKRLESGEGSAGRLVNDPELYTNLNAAATEMRALVSDVRKDPRKYLRVKMSLF